MRPLSLAPRLLAIASLAAAAPPSGPWPTAEPHFPHFPGRRVSTLSGTWAFGRAAAGTDANKLTYAAAAAAAAAGTATVPGVIDLAPPGELGWRGVSVFHAGLACTPGRTTLVRFEAVNFYSRVFIDGTFAGNHSGGYSPFEIAAPRPCGAGALLDLLVVVENTLQSPNDLTNTGGDFFDFSGIIRPVVATELPRGATGAWLARVEPITVDAAGGRVDVRAVFGGDLSSLGGSASLSIAFNGGAAAAPVVVPVSSEGDAVVAGLTVPGAQPWGIGEPNLFTVTVTATASGDAVTARSGLRTLGIDAGSRLTINGKRVKLTGYNRHTLWPDTGAAGTPAQEAADVALLRELNVNYVRGAHYPQSQSFLDLLDESGIVIWEETLGPGVSAKDINSTAFMSAHVRAAGEMVGASFAHPSVIFHAFFNEGPSNDPGACHGYAAMADAIRSRVATPGNAPMRYVTWANNHGSSDACIQHEDVISFNSYPGWYYNPGNASAPLGYWPEQIAWVEQHWTDKPFTVSETGGGGLYEWPNASAPAPGPQWSLQYQAALVANDATVILGSDRVSGLTLWQFADIKANDGDTVSCGQCEYLPHPNNLSVPWDCAYIAVPLCHRPRGENNKGAVDMWRRKKPVFDVVSKIYLAAQE